MSLRDPLLAIYRRAAPPVLRAASGVVAQRWAPYSRLLLVDDWSGWVISWEMREIARLARRLGVRVASRRWLSYSTRQSVFYGSQFVLANDAWQAHDHRVAITYFHGRPGTGLPECDAVFRRLRETHERIARVQVSHREMRDIVLETGIAPEKVFRIPIGINLSFFHRATADARRDARRRLGIPESAFLVGSFHKDGVGWSDGLQPKFVKGPDVFVAAMTRLKAAVPEAFALLTGPARGYVKAGLERAGVPFRHVVPDDYPQIGELYHALDLYLVASRQEGGPKGVLEAMASGVPLVTTRVGQAMDIVRHGENGWMVDLEDADGLAHWAAYVAAHRSALDPLLTQARRDAEGHAYDAQLPLWRGFFDGFVERAD